MMSSIEDAPRDVVLHGLQLLHSGLPPSAACIGGHAVTLLHEEGDGSATFDGAEDLIEQGSPMVFAAQLLAAPGPRLTRGPGNVDVQRGARQVLGSDVAVEALRAVVDKAEICGRPSDARGPGLSGSQASQEGAIHRAGCHIHAAEVCGEGEAPGVQAPSAEDGRRGLHGGWP